MRKNGLILTGPNFVTTRTIYGVTIAKYLGTTKIDVGNYMESHQHQAKNEVTRVDNQGIKDKLI